MLRKTLISFGATYRAAREYLLGLDSVSRYRL